MFGVEKCCGSKNHRSGNIRLEFDIYSLTLLQALKLKSLNSNIAMYIKVSTET